MKLQWTFIFALIFALVVALFAVFNVESVPVNYIFGETSLPLIIVILGSVLLGGLLVGSVGLIWQFRLKRTIRHLEKQLQAQTQVQAQEQQPEQGAEASETIAEPAIPAPPGSSGNSFSQH